MKPLTLLETDCETFENKKEKSNVFIALAYTPTCGTCQLAKRIVSILAGTLNEADFVQINLNLNAQLAMEYGIFSVPALLIFKQNRHCETIFAFEMAVIYEKILKYI